MTKLRAATLLLFTAITLSAAAPPTGAVGYSAGTERVVEAGFHLSNSVDLVVEAVEADVLSGADSSPPTRITESTACISIDTRSDSDPAVSFCGPVTITISPTLRMATVSGQIDKYTFSLSFLADDSRPQVIAEPTTSSASIGASRTGVADAEISGGVFTATTRGSSWYAEVQEKVKTAASGQ